jgi:hypothetical protein
MNSLQVPGYPLALWIAACAEGGDGKKMIAPVSTDFGVHVYGSSFLCSADNGLDRGWIQGRRGSPGNMEAL